MIGGTGASNRRALLISGWLTGIYFVVELGVGIWTQSIAVLADAFHTFSAVGGVLVALVAQRLSARQASPRETFGWNRAEIVGALVNGILLVGMAVVVIGMGAMRLMDPIELPTTIMLWVAAGGIATEVVALRVMYQPQKGNLNMQGAYWHIIQTFVGSLIIIVSALVIRFTGFLAIDPILGMAFGLVLFWASWSILKSSARILIEGTPGDLDLGAAVEAIHKTDGVTGVHHVHAWTITSGRNLFSGHITVRDFANDGARVLDEVTRLLKERFGIYFSTIQIEDRPQEAERGAEEIDIVLDGTA